MLSVGKLKTVTVHFSDYVSKVWSYNEDDIILDIKYRCALEIHRKLLEVIINKEKIPYYDSYWLDQWQIKEQIDNGELVSKYKEFYIYFFMQKC